MKEQIHTYQKVGAAIRCELTENSRGENLEGKYAVQFWTEDVDQKLKILP